MGGWKIYSAKSDSIKPIKAGKTDFITISRKAVGNALTIISFKEQEQTH